MLINYTEYSPVINDIAQSTITKCTTMSSTMVDCNTQLSISIEKLRNTVSNGNIIEYLKPGTDTILSIPNSLPNSYSPKIIGSIGHSIYKLVVSNKLLAITFIMGSFAAFSALCANIIIERLNVFITNTFLCLKKFVSKIINCMMATDSYAN